MFVLAFSAAGVFLSFTEEESALPSWFSDPELENGYILSSADDFLRFAEMISSGLDFSGKTVYLTSPIELTVIESAGGSFRGSFNGLGNSMTMLSDSKTALFESAEGATFCDLEIIINEGVRLLQDEFGGVLINSAVNSEFNRITVRGSAEFTYADASLEGSPLISGMIAGYAEYSEFINCACFTGCGGDAGVFAGSAVGSAFENLYSSCGGALVSNKGECSFENILACAPVSETDGVMVLSESELSPAEIVLLLNAGGEEKDYFSEWYVDGEGMPALHMHRAVAAMTNPTCTEKGSVTYSCGCGEILLKYETAVIEHSYGDGSIVEPTCTEEGYTLHVCTVCGYELKTDPVPAKGHKTTKINVVAATCVDKGYSGDTVCTVCGEVTKKGSSTKATGVHDWIRAEIVKEPTGDEDGLIVYYCKYCDATTSESLPRLGHELGEYTDYDETSHRALCSCGEYEYEEHIWDGGVKTKAETADDDGEITYTCTVCGHKRIEAVPALGHTHGAWTELDGEYHSALCSCGETLTEPHRFVGRSLLTRTDDGENVTTVYQYVCSVCGAQKIEEEISASEYVSEGDGGIDELEVDEPRSGNVKYYVMGSLALLLLGGIGTTVYIKKSDLV